MTRKLEQQFKGKILVAEDYPLNQELIKEMLEMMGCNVDVAGDGEEALHLYRRGEYDLVVMDIQMPKKDGYLTTREIRSDEKDKEKRIPIIALTASAFEETRDRCMEAGMDDFISKPLTMCELERVLKKFIGQ